MIPLLFKIKPYYRRLTLLTGLGLATLAFRVAITQTILFTFLIWNLFLAVLPLVISKLIRYNKRVNKSTHLTIILFFIWLVFLPNSPYIITDFIHLKIGTSTMWVDLLMLFIFALNGLVLGTLSMIDIFHFTSTKFNQKKANLLLFSVSILSGFGIFLGRFLRFNSWDIIAKPKMLMYCLYKSLFLQEAWLWTIGFGSFMWISFLILKPLIESAKDS